MIAIKNVLFFAVGALSLVAPRDVSDILSDLSTIDSNTNSLKSAADGYSGGVAGSVPVANAEKKLEDSITSATTDANNHAATTSSEAQQVIDYINNTLEPDVSAAVTSIINKKSQFQSAGLYNTVKSDFASLKNKTSTYGTALLSKAPSGSQSAGNAALNKVLADLQRGANAFP